MEIQLCIIIRSIFIFIFIFYKCLCLHLYTVINNHKYVYHIYKNYKYEKFVLLPLILGVNVVECPFLFGVPFIF